jgi:outer membrane lipoprotein SlyB
MASKEDVDVSTGRAESLAGASIEGGTVVDESLIGALAGGLIGGMAALFIGSLAGAIGARFGAKAGGWAAWSSRTRQMRLLEQIRPSV